MTPLPFPLGDERSTLLAWGRHGVWHGVRALGLGEGDEVLAPAYHHGSEIEALARAGLRPIFYEGGAGLAPDERELERALSPDVRALHLIHYLGFPQDARRWRRWCDERGLLLIEDAAQAWMAVCDGGPAGSFGDLAVFCLYKAFGVPEGALMVTASPPPRAALDRRVGVGPILRRHGAWLAGRSALAHSMSRPFQHRGKRAVGDELGLRDPSVMPWSSTPFLMRRLTEPSLCERRREHYTRLLEALGDSVPAPFDELTAGACPFVFPIRTTDKAGVLERLAAEGVTALDFWSLPHPALDVAKFPMAAERRATTVCLPVHQELRPRDVDAIAAAARRSVTAAEAHAA